jgi:hypothetical protein
MGNRNEQIQVEFHDRANEKFVSVHHAFQEATSKISRRNQEYLFQQLKKQYAAIMEQEMKMIANDILAKNKDEKQLNEVNRLLHQFIKDYLHRFIQKVNDL